MSERILQVSTIVHGTGALFRERQIKDYHLEHEPGVVAVLAAGVPSTFLVVPLASVPFIYDQDGEGACVAFSIAGAKSIEDFSDVGAWNHYDAEELYRACGGTGQNGISTDTALARARDVGLLAGSKRWEIASYLFAPESPIAWRQTLAAALVATGPCVVALQLPTQFGWDSGNISAGPSFYHQMCLVGYDGLGDSDNAIFLNSWGQGFGQGGFCRIAWGYLEGGGFQNNYVYGYQMVDVIEGPPPPPPPPGPIEFDASVDKANANLVKLTPDKDATGLKGKRVHVKELP